MQQLFSFYSGYTISFVQETPEFYHIFYVWSTEKVTMHKVQHLLMG